MDTGSVAIREKQLKDGEDVTDPTTPLVNVQLQVARQESHETGSTLTLDGVKRVESGGKVQVEEHIEYKLYKRRWIGILALIILNIVKGMNWVWFGAIAGRTSEGFDISLGQVNWFGNVPHISYLVFSWCVPILVRRFGLRNTAVFGSVVMLISAWLRFCGTLPSLSKDGSYALIMTSQVLVGIVAPCFQVVGPRYAEVWFDLKGRATATMIVAISDPLGTAVGQIIPPIFADVRFGIKILAFITTASIPLAFAVLAKPPSPPTYSGSLISPPLAQTMRAAFNFNLGPIKLRTRPGEQTMTRTERTDFFILFFVFGVLIAGTSSFSVFISQIFTPHGYSEGTAGIMGGVFLLSGLVAAILSAPLFDRVLIHYLARTVHIALPLLGVVWISLIFVVKPDNLAGIYVVLVAIASISFILLPVGLELGVEITRNAETSTAVLWSGGNAISFVWVLAMDALRADDAATPPRNMHRALIFNAAFICGTACLVYFFTGAQSRRKLDEEKAEAAEKMKKGNP